MKLHRSFFYSSLGFLVAAVVLSLFPGTTALCNLLSSCSEIAAVMAFALLIQEVMKE